MRAIVTGRTGDAAHAAWLDVAGERLSAVIGRGGIVRPKTEGDGGTPAGVMAIRRVLYRADRLQASQPGPPACRMPREPIAPDDGWCDAPFDPAYNRMVRLPHGASAEPLWREDAIYDLIAVLGFNDAPVVPQAGSAIFLHVLPPGGGPTAGCIGVARDDLLRLLAAGLTEIETRVT